MGKTKIVTLRVPAESGKNLPELKTKVKKILAAVPHKETVPAWDAVKQTGSEQSH